MRDRVWPSLKCVGAWEENSGTEEVQVPKAPVLAAFQVPVGFTQSLPPAVLPELSSTPAIVFWLLAGSPVLISVLKLINTIVKLL